MNNKLLSQYVTTFFTPPGEYTLLALTNYALWFAPSIPLNRFDC